MPVKFLRDPGMLNSILQLQCAVAVVASTMKPRVLVFYLALNILGTLAKINRMPLGSGLTLNWAVQYDEKQVELELHTESKEKNEWLAFGFSDYGEMSPSDLCIFWVGWKGKRHLTDTWSDKSGIISIDDKQNCRNFRSKQKGNTSIIFFTRKFDTCDSKDYVIQDGTTHIVWARGKGPLYNLEGLDLKSASLTGMQRTTLLVNESPPAAHPSDTLKLDITFDNVKLDPNVETTYWCKIFRLPKEIEKKHHIIEYGPILKSEGDNLVHHMEVFHCATGVDQVIPDYEGVCDVQKRPKKTRVCTKVLAAWAMGAQSFAYPEEAGSPIGGPDFNPYVMLEIHYHNPHHHNHNHHLRKLGLIDNSGFRLYITSSLRTFDAGIMELGLEYNDKMAIPPKQKHFQLQGFCIHACTAVGLPEKGITVFGSQLHTHLTGVRVWTKHVREGVELPELNRDNHYSQHFQVIRLLKKPVHVLPGDALITTCDYNTMDRENVTLTGFSISDEMCVNYIHYYPQVDLEVCKSSIPTTYLQDYFEYLKQFEEQNTASSNGISQNYKSIDWTPLRVKNLKKLYKESLLSMQCNKSSGDRFPGGWEDLPPTRIYLPLQKEKRNCRFIY